MAIFLGTSSFLFFLHCSIHSEARFLIGIFQILVIVTGVGFYEFLCIIRYECVANPKIQLLCSKMTYRVVVMFVVCNGEHLLGSVLNLDLWDGRDNIEFPHYYRKNFSHLNSTLLLTPCWPSPLYSIIHRPVNFITVSCAPTDDNELADYRDTPLVFMEWKYNKTVVSLGGKPDSVILNPIYVPLQTALSFFGPKGYSLDKGGYEYYIHMIRDDLLRQRALPVISPWLGVPKCYSRSLSTTYER